MKEDCSKVNLMNLTLMIILATLRLGYLLILKDRQALDLLAKR